jgi:LAS superfamily LD-carboxypeptidase LdcB
MDINVAGDSFGYTPESKWLAANCWKYGFIIRYPQGKQNITGYKYEPWHVRYLGKQLAKEVYDSGLSLEEFLCIDSKYKN